ncbi:MAG: acyl-CoA dehydrogenase family protein [Thermodesulfobacteriota bacterium]|nr:acyl-CoA dehydrogenase family protein [Thermodesulfobacteriota bacterium]
MIFELTEEQKAVKEMVKSFAEKELAPYIDQWEEEEVFPKEAFKKIAKLGLFGMTCPEKYGGTDMGFLTSAIIYEELGKVYRAMSYVSINNLVCFLIYKNGNEEQRRRWVVPLAKGDLFGGFVLTEPNAGSDAASIRTSADKRGDEYILNGTKIFISAGGEAEVYTVVAKTDKEKGAAGASIFVVEKGTPGFSFGKIEKKMGMCSYPTRELIFDDCKVPKDHLLGEEGKGFKMIMEALDGGRINIGAISVGLAHASLNKALNYSKERVQFGKHISEFQGIQFMLADMATDIEAARLLVYKAAYMKDHGQKVTKEAAMAKKFATDVAMRVTTDAVQILGGYGYMKDYTVERYMREAKVGQIVEGTNQIQRVVIARELLK